MKKEKGITLIALIITIIVMLILVGVTVSVALNGGLFETARDAATGTDKARIEEEMQGAILAALDNNGNINLDKLKEEISKIKGIESVGENFPLVVKDKNGNEWEINTNGEIKTMEPEVEKIITEEDEEYSYWKTDGQGTIVYYDLPEGVEPPETLIIPSKIGNEKITKIGYCSLTGERLQREEDGSLVYDEDGNLVELDSYGENGDLIPTGQMTKIKNIVISKGIEEIEAFAFLFCTQTESVNIPSSVKNIGEQSFGGCINLKNVIIGEGGLLTIGDDAFIECESLVSINLPEGLLTIVDSAFSHCTSIREITIPASVENMGSYSFSGWTNTQTIYIKGKTEQPPDSDNDQYSDIGWNANWLEGCNANIVWDK